MKINLIIRIFNQIMTQNKFWRKIDFGFVCLLFCSNVTAALGWIACLVHQLHLPILYTTASKNIVTVSMTRPRRHMLSEKSEGEMRAQKRNEYKLMLYTTTIGDDPGSFEKN
ncbi:hypothetical protein DERP_005886 [Dermatophagoides pteronyssinus]|uniref:Uncharacterized protein n=1 Tax=Dermatophagoides pteronyssinus TaxID=6956 RepID=A0ABQ8J9W0_DERPT|nr:hypothetical protein DERP_005886 [Dermatophagoides pteronyssinus]